MVYDVWFSQFVLVYYYFTKWKLFKFIDGKTLLVSCQCSYDGQSLFSLIRAFSVVNCQLIFFLYPFRASSQASDSF